MKNPHIFEPVPPSTNASWSVKQVSSSISLRNAIFPSDLHSNNTYQARLDLLLHDPENYQDPQDLGDPAYDPDIPMEEQDVRRDPKVVHLNGITMELDEIANSKEYGPQAVFRNLEDDSSDDMDFMRENIFDPVRYWLDMQESNLYTHLMPPPDLDAERTAWKENINEYYRYVGKDVDEAWPRFYELYKDFPPWKYGFFSFLDDLGHLIPNIPYYILRGIARPISMLINYQPPQSIWDDTEIEHAMHTPEARKLLYQLVVRQMKEGKTAEEIREKNFKIHDILQNFEFINEILEPRAPPKVEPNFTGWGWTKFWKRWNWAYEADNDPDYVVGKTSVGLVGHNQITYIHATNETQYHSSWIPLEYDHVHPVYNTPFVQMVQFVKNCLIIPFGQGMMLGVGFSFAEYLKQAFESEYQSEMMGEMVTTDNLSDQIDYFSPIPGKLQYMDHARLTQEMFAPGADMRTYMEAKDKQDLWYQLPTKYTDAGITPSYQSPYDDAMGDYLEHDETPLVDNTDGWRTEDFSWAHPHYSREIAARLDNANIAQVDLMDHRNKQQSPWVIDPTYQVPLTKTTPHHSSGFLGSTANKALGAITGLSRAYFDPIKRGRD